MEIWKTIKNYPNYQVSNLGCVKSICFGKNLILKIALDSNGYSIVCLHSNCIQKTKKVHQLVAEAFLNHVPCGHKLVINHKNFIKTDNRVENLEIVTARENSNRKHLKSSSKYIGVSKHNFLDKWESYICINGKKKYLGLFTTELEASKYYENALKSIENNEEIIIKKHIAKGYYFIAKINKWVARIYIDKKYKYIGRFNTEKEASKAYIKAYKKIDLIKRRLHI